MKDFKLDSLLEPISERVRTPFFASFVVSWLIVNWEILYVTFFFKKADFYGFDIINYLIHVNYINPCDNLIKPLIYSLIYLFIFPYFDFEIFKFNEKRKRLKIEEKINIGKEFSVSGKKYWTLYNQMQDAVKQFDEVYSKNADLAVVIAQKDTDLHNKDLANQDMLEQVSIEKEKSDKLNKQINVLRNRNYAYDIFKGSWQVRLSDKFLFVFENDEFYEINSSNDIYKQRNNVKVGSLVFFELDVDTNRLIMLIKEDNRDDLFFVMLYKETNGLYSGNVNGVKMTIDKDRRPIVS